mmetsp:Transcript_11321/g.45848  ORF Transcript_11321/g.45848 Transcript_11321/m.45848 type:complete len:269 (-) Transcript_11321:1185-1991(-)
MRGGPCRVARRRGRAADGSRRRRTPARTPTHARGARWVGDGRRASSERQKHGAHDDRRGTRSSRRRLRGPDAAARRRGVVVVGEAGARVAEVEVFARARDAERALGVLGADEDEGDGALGDEEGLAGAQVELVRAKRRDAVGPRRRARRAEALDADEDRGHVDGVELVLVAGLDGGDEDLELGHGRRVAQRVRALGLVLEDAELDVGAAHGVGEHVDEVAHVLVLGREPGAHDVVGARHALEDLARDVRVRLVGRHEERLARRDEEVI